jgi:hypothetical protein
MSKIGDQSMNVQLNILEKISLITGELAAYKEGGVLAIVRIEKITLEPDMLSFTLKPQSGQRIGLKSLKVFTVNSSFEYLKHSDGRYACSIVSWVLETDPIKVIYLSSLINRNASVDEVLSAMRRRQAFYDDETITILRGLVKFKNQIKNKKILFPSGPDFRGQSWGGAGVMVISNDEYTVKKYSQFDGITVFSEHASQIGELFRRIRRIIATSPKYSYLSKLNFWSDLADAANSVKQEHGAVRLEEVCDKVIRKAIEFLTREP